MHEGGSNSEIVCLSSVLRHTGGLQRRQKRLRAPIEDRWLGTIELDVDVVDEGASHRGQHVLNRVTGVVSFSQLRAPLGEHRHCRGGGEPLAAAIRANERDA